MALAALWWMLQKCRCRKRSAVAGKRRVGTATSWFVQSSSSSYFCGAPSTSAIPLSRRPDRHGGYSRLLRRLRSVGAVNAATTVTGSGRGGGDGSGGKGDCGNRGFGGGDRFSRDHTRDTITNNARGSSKARDSSHRDTNVAAINSGDGGIGGDGGGGGGVGGAGGGDCPSGNGVNTVSSANGNGGGGGGGGEGENGGGKPAARAVPSVSLGFPEWVISGFVPWSREPLPRKGGSTCIDQMASRPQGTTGSADGGDSNGDKTGRGTSSDKTAQVEKGGSTTAAANASPAAMMEGLMFVLGRALGTLVRIVVRVVTGWNVAHLVGADPPLESSPAPPSAPAEGDAARSSSAPAATSVPKDDVRSSSARTPANTPATVVIDSASPPAPVNAAVLALNSMADAVPPGSEDAGDRKGQDLDDGRGPHEEGGGQGLRKTERRQGERGEGEGGSEGGGGGGAPKTWQSVIDDVARNPKNRCELDRRCFYLPG